MTARFLTTVAALLGCASTSLGQNSETRIWELPDGTFQTAGRADHGRLRHPAVTDAVVVLDGEATVLVAPGVYRSRVQFDEPVHDIAILDGGDLDHLVAVGPHGLFRWRWNGSVFVEEQLASDWAGAEHVETGDIDGNGFEDIVGVRADRTRLQILYNGPNGFGSTHLSPEVLDIRDVKLLRWDDETQLSIATLSGSWLLVSDHLGNVDSSDAFLTWNTDGRLAVYPIGPDRDGLIGVAPGPAAGDSMTLLSDGGVVHQFASMGPLTSVGLAVGDLDGNGMPELVTSANDAPDLAIFRSSCSSLCAFARDDSLADLDLTGWSGVGSNEAEPIAADFDGDGDEDLLFVPAESNSIRRWSNPDVAAADSIVTFASVQFIVKPPVPPALGGDAKFSVRVVPPAVNPGWTHLEVRQFRQARFDYYVEPEPHQDAVRFDLAPVIEVDVETNESEWFPDVFYATAHMVKVENGVVTRQWPSETICLGLIDPMSGLAELEGMTVTEFEVTQPFLPKADTNLMSVGPTDTLRNPVYLNVELLPITRIAGGGSGCLPELPETPPNSPPNSPWP